MAAPHEVMNWQALTGEFYCVDVGSRGGLDDLHALHPWLNVYSIDADPAAETRPQRFASRRHFSLALHSSQGERDFFLAARPSLSSLLEFDPEAFARHFGLMPGSEHWARALTPQRKQTTKTETADRFLGSQGLERIDYLKLDTQGTELEILKGAREYLSAGKIMVIKTEVSLLPVYRDQCTFSDVDRFLKTHGFLFVDCAFYPDAVVAQSAATAVRGISVREQTRFSAGGDAFYVLDPRHYKGDDGTGFLVRSAVLLNQLGYVSVAFDILRNSLPADRIEALLRATTPADPKSRLKRALKNSLPPFAYRGIQRLRERLRSGS